jgi:hypothetical protein
VFPPITDGALVNDTLDDKGLVLPPNLPIQVVVMPIHKTDEQTMKLLK